MAFGYQVKYLNKWEFAINALTAHRTYLCFGLFNKYVLSYRIKKNALEFIERHKFDNTLKCRCRNTHKPKFEKMSNLKLFFIEYLKIKVIKLSATI